MTDPETIAESEPIDPGQGLSAEPWAADWRDEASWELERTRKIYRARTVAMLRRYMRYSLETGRLPSLLGREFFRAKVTSYTVVTFEDRVIFVHDMEKCLDKLDEFSRQLIARHILQEHDQAATGKLLNCTERTVRTYVPITLDLLSDILLEVGLLEPQGTNARNSCQGGKRDEIFVSDCEQGDKFFPVRVGEFAILNIESEKRKDLLQKARRKARLLAFGEEFTNSYRVLAMMKKKGKKSRKAGKGIKKATKNKKSSKSKKGKKERDAKEVRHECSKLVKEDAREVTVAVIGEAKKGQLGPMKYLFEMANIFPQADDGSQTSAEEESLAETLLNRLGIPSHPVVADEYEKAANEVIPAGPAGKEDGDEELEAEKAPEKAEIDGGPDAMIGCE